jgi:hypothetical protein
MVLLNGGVSTTSTSPGVYGGLPYDSPYLQNMALQAQARADMAGSMGETYNQNALQAFANQMIGNSYGTGLGTTSPISMGNGGFGGAANTSPRLYSPPTGTSSFGGEAPRTQQPLQGYAQQQQPIYLPIGGGEGPSFNSNLKIDLSGLMTPRGNDMAGPMAAIAAILAHKDAPNDPVNYKPYNDILQRFPQATAQLPQDNFGVQRQNRNVYDTDLNAALGKPVGPAAQPTPAQQADNWSPVRPVGGVQQYPQMAPEQPQMIAQAQQAPQQAPEPLPQQQPQSIYRAQQQPYSPTGTPETDLLMRSQPMYNPQYAQAYAQQQAMQAYAQQQAVQGPPRMPMQPMPPGAAPGWAGFAQRGAMLNPGNRALYGNTYRNQMQYQQQMYGDQSANWRQQMQAAATMNDAAMRETGQNAREMQRLVGEIVKDSIKQPTPDNLVNQGMKIVDAYPPGPERDRALAAAQQYGLDLWNFRNVPQSQKAASMEQGREDRHATSTQKYDQNEKMNPLRLAAQEMRNTRLEKTNPALIRMTNARADLADLKLEQERTYGDATKQADLAAKQQRLQGEVVKQTQGALAKANTINQQYENAYKDYLNAGTKDKAEARKKIEGAFGPIDPDTGLPKDVLDARKTSRELTAQVARDAMNQQPQQAAQPATKPMQQQMQQMKPAPTFTPDLIPTYMAKAQQAVPGGSVDAIRKKASELARADGYKF